MIRIFFNTKDPFRIIGIRHFCQKYSFEADDDEETAIKVVYSKNFDNNSNIILENDIQKEISGYLKTEEKKLPLFEKPIKLEEYDEIIGEFEDENEKYPCIVVKNNMVIMGVDFFNEIGHILSGHLEGIWKSKSHDDRLKKTPFVDYYENILFKSLLKTVKEQKLHLKSFWPDNKKFAVCLTHDVDRVNKTYQYFTHFAKHLLSGNFPDAISQIRSIWEKLCDKEPYWNFETILGIEKNFQVKSTFFFLNEKEKPNLFRPKTWMLFSGRYNFSDSTINEIIKFIHKNGWEVGLHGSYNSYIDKLKLKNDKSELESIINGNIRGIRQHHLNIEIPLTWQLQEEVGFRYDTTLGFRRGIGFRNGTSFPYFIFDCNEQSNMLEIPLIIMDVAFIKSGKIDYFQECKEMIDLIEETGGLLTILWHTEKFNEKEFPYLIQLYKDILNESKKRNAWITNAGEIEQWWTSRVSLYKNI